MKFWKNVLGTLETRAISLRALALAVGVTPGAMSHYSRGGVPSLDVAARIAKHLDLSLDGLVWGENPEALVPLCKAPEEHTLLRELTAGVGLDELLRLAELSSQSLSWEIMMHLARNCPRPITLKELRQELGGASEHHINLSLLALRRRGAIVESEAESGEITFGMREPVAHFNLREIGDICGHVLHAARVLFRKVLPAAERMDGSAHLVSVCADVPREVAAQLAIDVKEFIKTRSREAMEKNGTTRLDLICAVAVSDLPR